MRPERRTKRGTMTMPQWISDSVASIVIELSTDGVTSGGDRSVCQSLVRQ